MSDETPQRQAGRRARRYDKSGLYSLKAAVKLLGGRAIDRRTRLGQALEAWRDDLMSDLGDATSSRLQQVALIDVALKTKLMLDSVDAWILKQPSLVNARKRALIPVVRDRSYLAGQFAGLMKDLGLSRRARPLPSLVEHIAQLEARKGRPGDVPLPETASVRPASPAGKHGRDGDDAALPAPNPPSRPRASCSFGPSEGPSDPFRC